MWTRTKTSSATKASSSSRACPSGWSGASGGAWTEAARTETDLYGKYAFTGLSAGEYRVICTLSGQELYAVSVGTSMASEDGAVLGEAVTLEDGKSVSGGDVGLAPSARLKLTIFQDSNGDGKRGDYDRGVPGIEVTLLEGKPRWIPPSPTARARRRSMRAPAATPCA